MDSLRINDAMAGNIGWKIVRLPSCLQFNIIIPLFLYMKKQPYTTHIFYKDVISPNRIMWLPNRGNFVVNNVWGRCYVKKDPLLYWKQILLAIALVQPVGYNNSTTGYTKKQFILPV
jgi:hypothetical protein